VEALLVEASTRRRQGAIRGSIPRFWLPYRNIHNHNFSASKWQAINNRENMLYLKNTYHFNMPFENEVKPMTKYVALLRGVNVGGKNKVVMRELKELLERNGFFDVVTYINSGNIIFASECLDIESLKRSCEALIYEEFKLEISSMVMPAQELLDAVNNAPDWWGSDRESKHNALFVMPPTIAAEVMQAVGAYQLEYERVSSFGQVIFWSAPLKTFSRTRWSRIVEKPIYHQVTIRNSNTVRNLAQMVLEYKA
jgi:uncharacterized protein (DUF1697 family)